MKNGFYEKKLETMERGKLEALQLKRLKAIVRHVYEKNPVYRKSFDDVGIKLDVIKTLADISKLPTINKTVFRETYPMGLCCVDKKKIVEMHMSSGSTGTPVVMPYTQGDLDQWASCMARCYAMAGVEPTDVVQGHGWPTLLRHLEVQHAIVRIFPFHDDLHNAKTGNTIELECA